MMEVKIFGISGSSEVLRIVLEWKDPDRGFGQIQIMQYSDGSSTVVDSELTGRDFVKSVVNTLLDNARIIGEHLDKS
jgi:hypothetical protein